VRSRAPVPGNRWAYRRGADRARSLTSCSPMAAHLVHFGSRYIERGVGGDDFRDHVPTARHQRRVSTNAARPSTPMVTIAPAAPRPRLSCPITGIMLVNGQPKVL